MSEGLAMTSMGCALFRRVSRIVCPEAGYQPGRILERYRPVFSGLGTIFFGPLPRNFWAAGTITHGISHQITEVGGKKIGIAQNLGNRGIKLKTGKIGVHKKNPVR